MKFMTWLVVVLFASLVGLWGLEQFNQNRNADRYPARGVLSDAMGTVADETAAMPDSIAYFEALPAMASDMPVTIISRAISAEPTQFDLDWREGQTQLSETYSGAQWVMSDSENHHVQIADPDLVVGQIRRMIEGL